MIESIRLKAGSNPGQPPLVFNPDAVTVFVGPNNSGKSLLLREIERAMSTSGAGNFKVLDSCVPTRLPSSRAANLIDARISDPPANDPNPAAHIRYVRTNDLTGRGQPLIAVNYESIRQTFGRLESGEILVTDIVDRIPEFFSLYVVRLDGRSRFGLTEPRPTGNTLTAPTSHLGALFQNHGSRQELQEATRDAFGLTFVLDPHEHGMLKVRMSETEPASDAEEQNWDAGGREFHRRAIPIEDTSDGVQAFTGMLSAILSDDFKVMLIDEPEAFLHPSLALKLGRRIGRLAQKRDANVFVSTHSPEFLMGCIETGDVNVVRLTFKSGVGTARLLSSDTIEAMVSDPMLRSTGVLGGLFSEGVVVTEGDSDRVVYQEVDRQVSESDAVANVSVLYLNARNKQTIKNVVKVLRGVGIPAAAVCDLDLIKDREFNNLIREMCISDSQVSAWNTQRAALNKVFSEKNIDMKIEGIFKLPDGEKQSAEQLLEAISSYGVFLAPVGDLEQWFEKVRDETAVAGKNEFVSNVFGLMKSEPHLFADKSGDIWKFIRKIRVWIGDPSRYGIPD